MSAPGDIAANLLKGAMGYKVSRSIFWLLDNGVLARVVGNWVSATVLAEEFDLHLDALTCLLGLLVSVGLLQQNAEGQYGLPAEVGSILPILQIEGAFGQFHIDNDSLGKSIRTGEGQDPFEKNAVSAKMCGIYNQAMSELARKTALLLYRKTALKNMHTIIDLGGADGAMVRQLGQYLRDAQFIVIDRPHNQEAFAKQFADTNIQVQYLGTDVRVPKNWQKAASEADAVICSNILHHLTKEQIHQTLGMLASLNKPLYLIVYDQFFSDMPAVGNWDLNQLMVYDWIHCGSYFDFTVEAFKDLLKHHGFQNISSTHPGFSAGQIITASL